MTPDVEALVLKILAGLGTVSTKVPNPMPDEFVRVSLAGGSGDQFLDDVSLIVEAWAPTTVRASELARTARAALHEARFNVVDGWQIYGVSSAYPACFPDDVSERYQFLTSVRVRRA